MNVLRALGDRDPLPVGDLARAARMDTGAVSRQVRVLEEEGLVERHSSPQHGSIVLVVATEEGRAMAQRFERVRSAQLSRALIEWTPEERAQLGALMVRLVDDLQATPYLQTDGD
jgi:DNA-binding MarR family transcriptional regulator